MFVGTNLGVVAANWIRPGRFCIEIETLQLKVNRDGVQFYSGLA